MAQPFRILLASAILSGSLSSPVGSQASEQPRVRAIPLTKSIHLPMLKRSDTDTSDRALSGMSPMLSLSPGAIDEPPEGPSGFDVFDDGTLLLTDPLVERIAVFDPQGKFLRGWKLGFAPDSITVASEGVVLIREANTGAVHVFDRQGNERSGLAGKTSAPSANVRRISGSSGAVDRGCGQAIAVHFDEPGSSLLSLESLGTDAKCVTFVALETSARAAAAHGIEVRKSVRRYASDGQLTSEVAQIPLNYYVAPVDELRVRKGIVYQLSTTSTEVRLNEWDMN